MARPSIEIDRGKLRAAIRKLGHEHVYDMLDDAIELLPPAKLHKIVRTYLNVRQLGLEAVKGTTSNLVADVMAFEKASLAGEYYEFFDVNYKNSTEKSMGTVAWIADCNRLLDRCVGQVRRPRSANPAEVCQAFNVVFGLLDRIDECREDIIFFADEAGAWQVGVDWDRVLPPWFKVLSVVAAPEEYAGRINTLLDHHYKYGRDKMLVVARKAATPEQRVVLAEVVEQQAGPRKVAKR